jgi:hypothetical protein
MDPTVRDQVARRENGRRKAAVVTTVAVFVGAAAVGGISVALATDGSAASTSTTPSGASDGSAVQPQDQLQPPDRHLRGGSGSSPNSSSGAS